MEQAPEQLSVLPEAPIAPQLVEHKVQISESRYVKVRGFADKPRVDLVLIVGTHEQLLCTLNACDVVNISWLLEHVVKQLATAHERWLKAHPDQEKAA